MLYNIYVCVSKRPSLLDSLWNVMTGSNISMQRIYMFEYRCIKDTNHQIFNINRVNIVKQIDN
jgi:hypothetical protein